MFYKYEIKNNGTEDILYLYLTMSYEFSRELLLSSDEEDLCRRSKNFIKSNNINYDGNKIYLVIDGIVVKSLDISKYANEIEILKDNLFYSNEHFLVTVRMDNDQLIELPLKEYLLSVLAQYYYPDLNIEVLKSICIIYRSYIFNMMSQFKEISYVDSFISYRPISYYKLVWTKDYEDVYNYLSLAIKDTDCIFISYDDRYILPFIHFSNCGFTYKSKDYPYLSSVKSLWDLASPYYVEIKEYSYELISKLLNLEIDCYCKFNYIEIDERNFVTKLSINGIEFDGEVFKRLLNLKSLNINIILNKNYFKIITKGYGDFYGLSIFGSNELAKNGSDFPNILKYYFPNCRLKKYIKELS